MPDAATRFIALIVDPDDGTRHLAAALLEEVGLFPVDCRSAAKALDALHEHSQAVALLFTDVRLPGEMGGIVLAREVEERWPHVSLLITSKYPRSWLGKPTNATFVRKPWLPLQVLIEAERSLQRARQRRHGADIAIEGAGDAMPLG